jgi:hypothetical protein
VTLPPLLRALIAARRLDDATAGATWDHARRTGVRADTALVQLGLLEDDELLAFLPRACGGGVADGARLTAATTAAIAALPRAVAEQHALVPLDLAGRKLTVACCVPDDVAAFDTVLDEVGFALRLYLRPLWTTERLGALHRHRLYGSPLPAFVDDLLGGRDGRRAQWPPSARAARNGADAAMTSGAPPGRDGDAAPRAHDDGDDLFLFAAVGDAAAPASQPPRSIDAGGWSASSTTTTRDGWPRGGAPAGDRGSPARDESGWTLLARGERLLDDDDDAPLGSARLSLVVDGTVAAANLPPGSSGVRDDDHRRDEDHGDRRRRRRTRVTWSVADAAAELALARSRDELLEVALRFAWRRLQTASLVVRQGASLVVWDILDPVHDGDDLRNAPLPAEGDHALARVFALGSPYLGPLDADDPLMRLLGRAPRAVVVVPVALPGRHPVAALVGDNGDRAIPLDVVAGLHRIGPRLGHALAALILRRKHAGATGEAIPRSSASPTPSTAPSSPLSSPPSSPTATPLSSPTATPTATRAEDAAAGRPAELELALDDAPATPSTTTQVQPATMQVQPATILSPGVLLARWHAWRDGSGDDVHRADVDGAAGGDERAAARVRAAGAAALPALARAFPGPLLPSPFAGPARPLSAWARPAPGSVPGLLVDLGAEASAPIVVGALEDAARDARWAATWLLATLPVPAALPRLAARVFDVESRIAALAVEVLRLRRHDPGFAAVLERLRNVCRRGDNDERAQAVGALAGLRDAGAVPVLVGMLEARPAELAAAAHDALVVLAGVDHGFSTSRWRAWCATGGATVDAAAVGEALP